MLARRDFSRAELKGRLHKALRDDERKRGTPSSAAEDLAKTARHRTVDLHATSSVLHVYTEARECGDGVEYTKGGVVHAPRQLSKLGRRIDEQGTEKTNGQTSNEPVVLTAEQADEQVDEQVDKQVDKQGECQTTRVTHDTVSAQIDGEPHEMPAAIACTVGQPTDIGALGLHDEGERADDSMIIEVVLDALEEVGSLCDERFVTSFVESRVRRGKGSLLIRAELRERGVDEALVDRFLTFSDAYWEEKASVARNKRFGDARAIDAAERNRQARFLAGRGFTSELIRRVVMDR